MADTPITTLFCDVGGVLLTNGWDHNSRRRAAEQFHLDAEEVAERHHLTFDTYEEGKLSLDEYLDRLVFYEPRSFSRDDFKRFMYAQSKPHSEMIAYVRDLKVRHGLKVVVVSNEGRELTAHRIKTFDLSCFVDAFVCSCFVHFRKPDVDIFRMALDISQVEPDEALYIDDRSMFVEVAATLGIRGIVHRGLEATRQAMSGLSYAAACRV